MDTTKFRHSPICFDFIFNSNINVIVIDLKGIHKFLLLFKFVSIQNKIQDFNYCLNVNLFALVGTTNDDLIIQSHFEHSSIHSFLYLKF
jgi:hypothetical protein